MMGYAYYSRHEHTQKLALCILGIYIVSQAAIHTPLMYKAYLVFDLVGLIYAAWLRVRDPDQTITRWVFWLFVAMLMLHGARADNTPWIQYQIAGNLLFLAQLTALCIYGKHYGIIARTEVSEPRTDIYYRALTACRLMT